MVNALTINSACARLNAQCNETRSRVRAERVLNAFLCSHVSELHCTRNRFNPTLDPPVCSVCTDAELKWRLVSPARAGHVAPKGGGAGEMFVPQQLAIPHNTSDSQNNHTDSQTDRQTVSQTDRDRRFYKI